MNSIKKYLAFGTGFCLLLGSCDSALNVEPISTITAASFWKTEDDAQGGLTAIYVDLRSQTESLFKLGEGRSDMMEHCGMIGTYDTDLLYNQTLTPERPLVTWNSIYVAINSTNLVIKKVPDISFRTETDKNNMLAQAYTNRAYLYFVLVRTWGETIIRTEPTESYDPLTVNKPRSSVAETFDLIKSDLDQALKLYSDNSFVDGRNCWSRSSANALKAEVYLWTAKRLGGGNADLQTALDACNEVDKADVALLDNYADVNAYTNKVNKEILMAIGFKRYEVSTNYVYSIMYLSGNIAPVPPLISQATHEEIGTRGGESVWTISKGVREQFTNDDTRKNATFFEVIYETGVYFTTLCTKRRGFETEGQRLFLDDYILYRYADVLLMKAEAKNGLGQDPSAEINQVRKRAYKDAYPEHIYVNQSKELNDAAILKERLFELALEGKRWWDVLRFDKAFELVPNLSVRYGDRDFLLFPIANTVLSLEPEVKQNPGW
jgi:hypothetical protein